MKNNFVYICRNLKASFLIFYRSYRLNDEIRKFKYSYQNCDKTMIILGTPTHGNLGDQAIAYAEREFLKLNYPEYCIFEVSNGSVPYIARYLKKEINRDMILFIHGGGNLGNIYIYAEKIRRLIVKKLSNTPIISFPQSMIFESTKYGNYQLEKSNIAYSRNVNFRLVAREKISYMSMKNVFKRNEVYLIPDIVFSVEPKFNFKRNDVLFLLRKDIEKDISSEDIKSVEKIFEALNMVIDKSDTHIGDIENFSIKLRDELIFKKLEEISKHKIVVTDRLHGMIFSYITKTPCIVFSNSNHKIKSTYELFLKDVDFIYFVEKELEKSKINDLLELESESLNYSSNINHDQLKQIIESVFKKND